MNGVTLNFDANTVAPSKPLDPIPSGWYYAQITESEMKPTSKPGGQMLALTLVILDGPFAGRKVFDRLNLVNDNPTAVQIGYETLSAISHSTGVIQVANSTQLHGIPMKVKVKLNNASTKTEPDGTVKNYDASNEVKGYDHVNSDHPVGPSGPVTAGGVAGAPVGAPVWAVGAPAAAPAAAAPAFAAPAAAPPAAAFQPPVAAQPWQQPAAAAAPAAPAAPFVPPAAAPPAPVGPVMLPAANGATYDQFRQKGWTDEAMIAQGFMAAPVAAVPVAPVAPVAPVFTPPAAAPAFAAPAAPGTQAPPWAR